MAALATCTVSRANKQYLDKEDPVNGFVPNEESYAGVILAYENAKVWVVKTSTKKHFWVNVNQISNIVPIL